MRLITVMSLVALTAGTANGQSLPTSQPNFVYCNTEIGKLVI